MEESNTNPPGRRHASPHDGDAASRYGPTGYPGSKGASGVCERILRQMPPHRVYVEAFAGMAAVWRKKRPASESILIDLVPSVVAALQALLAGKGDPGRVILGDALQLIPSLPAIQDPDTLLYCDPPYLREVRTRLFYECEFAEPEQHASLLALLLELPCMVMISGYWSALYEATLMPPRWRVFTINAMTRGGIRVEHVWCNFPEPDVLHDPRWAGKDFRERERIKRKARRWVTRYLAMPPRERQAVASELAMVDRLSLEAALTAAAMSPTARFPGVS